MMGFKSKMSSGLVLFSFLSLVFVQPVSADGMIHVYDPDMRWWGLQGEGQQLCAINYEDGFENMILSVDISDLHGEKAVWIFPVPAKPEVTAIDIMEKFPRLSGYDVQEKAGEVISDVFTVMTLSQVYTFPFVFAPYFAQVAYMGPGIGEEGEGEGVTIHEHIEKMGLATELVTAEDGGAFHSYLTNKGLELPADSKSVLDEYIGQEYSFVVSWISDVERFKEATTTIDRYGRTINTVSVFIAFPTDNIYFPLKPTSVYENQDIPILIYVMGHVTPELYPGIVRGTHVNYFVERHYDVPGGLSLFFNGRTRIEDLKYTKIRIHTSSNYLTEDLWIEDSAPADVVLAEFINRQSWLWGTTFFAMSSCLASMFAGAIIFRKGRLSKKKFALFGLWNLFTLIGFVVASMFLIREKPQSQLEQQPQSQRTVDWGTRKTSFVFLFSVSFIIITLAFRVVLQSIF